MRERERLRLNRFLRQQEILREKLKRTLSRHASRIGDLEAKADIAKDSLLDHDANELDLERCTVRNAGEKIAVPDTQYDSEFWRDIDDEGVGGHRK